MYFGLIVWRDSEFSMVSYYKKGIMLFFMINILIILSSSVIATEDISINDQPYSLATTDGEIIYDYQHGQIMATGGVIFTSPDLLLECNQLLLFPETGLIEASGDVTLTSEHSVLTGTYLQYNYISKAGLIRNAASEIEQVYFKSQEIKLITEQDYQLELVDAAFTKCIHAQPHYQVKAQNIQIYPNDRIVAQNVEFYWRKVKLLTLPVYVMKYSDDERLDNTIPLPNIGYNTEDGLYLDYNYAYEYKGLAGEASFSVEQHGDRKVSIAQNYRINPAFSLLNNYRYQKEIEEDGKLEEEHYINAGIEYGGTNFTYYNGLEYNFLNRDKKLSSLFKYQRERVDLSAGIKYNLDTAQREEALKLNYLLTARYHLSLEQDYLNERPVRALYRINYRGDLVNWELIQQEGFETEYLPYLMIRPQQIALQGISLNSRLGLGRVSNAGVTAAKIKSDFTLKKDIEISPAFKLGFTGGLINHQYFTPQRSYYRVYQGGISTAYQTAITPSILSKIGLSYQVKKEAGTPLIAVDRAKELGQSLKPEFGVSLLLPEEGSSLEVKLSGLYYFESGEWDQTEIMLTRNYDCYSYSLDYNPVEQAFGFRISFR